MMEYTIGCTTVLYWYIWEYVTIINKHPFISMRLCFGNFIRTIWKVKKYVFTLNYEILLLGFFSLL